VNLCHDEFLSKEWESKDVLRSYLNIILFELERLYSPQEFEKAKNIKQHRIHAFEEFIDANFKLKKLPSGYADLLNVSTNYLNKICKEETGQTAGDLIRKRIIIEAQRLLHYTHLSINEVAYELGYENTSYFVTSFKKQTGFTPEQFRQKQN
jgi:AraC family transcriptional activator of pobA